MMEMDEEEKVNTSDGADTARALLSTGANDEAASCPELVPGPGNRRNKHWAAWIILKLLPQGEDMHIDCTAVSSLVVSPHCTQQFST